MPLKTILFFLLFPCLWGFTAWGQVFHLQGKVYDAKAKTTLPGATVELIKLSDSTRLGTATDTAGFFQIEGLSKGKYFMRVSYLGYESHIANINLVKNTDLGKIALQPSGHMLKEATITAAVLPVQQKGDTTEFNAKAYKVHPDADAADLVKKMPGMEVSGQDVKAHGESVVKVVVDGKPFMGTDPYAALKNLPAEMVDKVQVFNEKSDQEKLTGVSEGPTTKTINVITDPNKRIGEFGKTFLGYGADGNYIGGVNMNKFDGKRRLTVALLSDNVNIQNATGQDLVGLPSGGGISTIQSAALNYTDSIGKKIDFALSYNFYQNKTSGLRSTIRHYVLSSDSGQTYNENSNNSNNNYNHRVYMRFNYTIDTMNIILFTPQMSVQKNYGLSSLLGYTMDTTDLLNQTMTNNNSTGLGYNLNAGLNAVHKFQKTGRNISLNANISDNHNEGTNRLNSQNLFFTGPGSDTLNQRSVTYRDGMYISSNLNYVEPITKKTLLQFQYSFTDQPSQSERNTFNYSNINNAYDLLDTTLSNTFKSTTLLNKLGTSYQYKGDKLSTTVGIYYQYTTLHNNQELPIRFIADYFYNNVFPGLSIQYKFTDKKRLSFYYTTNTSTPSVSQLQNVINNTNPLLLSEGNPELRQQYSHNFTFRYNATHKSSSFNSYISGTIIQDNITNNTILAQADTAIAIGDTLRKGGQLTVPINVQGYWNTRFHADYGFPFPAIKCNLSFYMNGSYSHSPGVINNALNYSENENGSLGFSVTSNINENIDFTFQSNSSYNVTHNTTNPNLSTNYFNQSNSLSLNCILPYSFVFHSDVSYQYNSGLSAGYNQNYVLWNLSFGKKFLKSKRADLRITIYDLLKENTNIQHNVTEIYIADVRSNTLQRYFMLLFSYKFSHFKKVPIG